MIPVNGSSLLLNARATVPEESVLQLKGREKLLFITVAEVQLDFLSPPTLVDHSLHGVADGNTNCAHGTVISRILIGQKFC